MWCAFSLFAFRMPTGDVILGLAVAIVVSSLNEAIDRIK